MEGQKNQEERVLSSQPHQAKMKPRQLFCLRRRMAMNELPFYYSSVLLLVAILSVVPTATWALKPMRFVLKPPAFLGPPQVQLECCPLIGGPPFLPLHVQVVVLGDNNNNDDVPTIIVDDKETSTEKQIKYKFDFIPRAATEPETLVKLLSLQEVPGELRCFTPSAGVAPQRTALVELAQEFTVRYDDPKLHIIKNNCWTFAWRLLRHLKTNHQSEQGSY